MSSSGRLASSHWRSSSRNFWASGPRSISMVMSLRQLELREVAAVAQLFPGELHRLADGRVVGRAVDDVRHQPDPVVQLDEGDHVRHPVRHRRVGRLLLHGGGVDRPRAARLPPRQRVRRQAGRAHLAGIEDGLVAGVAALDEELLLLGRLPEGLADVADGRFEPGHQRVASVPSTAVDMQDSTIPDPWATAMLASSTWRGPHSPRSWRTASTTRNIPYIPGCVYDRPPPLVFMAKSPPGPRFVDSTNAPPSPFSQNPR